MMKKRRGVEERLDAPSYRSTRDGQSTAGTEDECLFLQSGAVHMSRGRVQTQRDLTGGGMMRGIFILGYSSISARGSSPGARSVTASSQRTGGSTKSFA